MSQNKMLPTNEIPLDSNETLIILERRGITEFELNTPIDLGITGGKLNVKDAGAILYGYAPDGADIYHYLQYFPLDPAKFLRKLLPLLRRTTMTEAQIAAIIVPLLIWRHRVWMVESTGKFQKVRHSLIGYSKLTPTTRVYLVNGNELIRLVDAFPDLKWCDQAMHDKFSIAGFCPTQLAVTEEAAPLLAILDRDIAKEMNRPAGTFRT